VSHRHERNIIYQPPTTTNHHNNIDQMKKTYERIHENDVAWPPSVPKVLVFHRHDHSVLLVRHQPLGDLPNDWSSSGVAIVDGNNIISFRQSPYCVLLLVSLRGG
jgi:hypothetical protein